MIGLFIFKVIVVLGYSGILESSSQGGAGVPCPPFCDLLAPPLLSFSVGSLCWLRPSVFGWLKGWVGMV